VSAPGDGLDELRAAWPGFTFWRGTHTGSCWAMPRTGGDLVEAPDPEALAALLPPPLTARLV
jgi:hypothetical protein